MQAVPFQQTARSSAPCRLAPQPALPRPTLRAPRAPRSIRELRLSPQQALSFKNEADALAQLRPEIDGVVFKYGAIIICNEFRYHGL